jgi:hypothetical protein
MSRVEKNVEGRKNVEGKFFDSIICSQIFGNRIKYLPSYVSQLTCFSPTSMF